MADDCIEIPHGDANLWGFVDIIGAHAKKLTFEGFLHFISNIQG
jgi:hypothetical protein